VYRRYLAEGKTMNAGMRADLTEERYYRHLNIPSGDLRVSITADCNMRCAYCHNEGQGDFAKVSMSEQDLRRVVEAGLRFGVNKVRLTGGEPMMHPRLLPFVEMLKREYLIQNVGLNTNGTMLSRAKAKALLAAGLDVAVVGVDFPDGPISKDSSRGRHARTVLANVADAAAVGLNVQIASVYSNTTVEAVSELFQWCQDHHILLKVLEVSDETIEKTTSREFSELVEFLRDRYSLRMGRTVSLNERYGVTSAGARILFFHSHCRVRECRECSQMHMRVTAMGSAKPCILRQDTEFDLLSGDAELALRRAVHNLGNPPERPAI
jgi:GTP 3',8-cyclase